MSALPALALDAYLTLGQPLDDAPLAGKASVCYDASGTPHVSSPTVEGLYFAFGYATARDRLWQLEVLRRTGRGTIGELLGMDKAKSDFFVHALSIPQNSEKIVNALDRAAEPWRILSSYTDGINAFLREPGHPLPPEFRTIGERPGRWTPQDCVAVIFLQGLDLAQWSLYDRFAYRDKASEIGGDEGVKHRQQLEPYVRYETLTGEASYSVVGEKPGPKPKPKPKPKRRSRAEAEELESLFAAARSWLPDRAEQTSFGSNVFVISGQKSASGKPMLANDPHLRLAAPSFWYRAHLTCQAAGLNVSGFSVPGVPAIVCGRSDHMAWGVTYLYADSFDVFVERLAPDGSDAVRFKGHEEPIRSERPTVWVKMGGIKIPVFWQALRYTRHGFILAEDKKKGIALSIKFAGTDVVESKLRLLSMGHATSVAEFREELRDLFQPTLNFCFADDAGHIGYQTAGFVPKRDNRDRMLAVPGDTGEYEWDGFVPFEQMPGGVDPQHGFFANANNYPVAPEKFPSYYSSAVFPHYRGQRIDELLRAESKLSLADLAAIQTDVLVPDARIFRPQLLELFRRETEVDPATDSEKGAVAVVAAWNGEADVNQEAPVIWRAWWRTLQKNLDRVGLDGSTALWFQQRLSLRADRSGQLRPASNALRTALAELQRLYGPPPWKWGRLHRAVFAGDLDLSAGGFAPDPIAAPGDRDTVCVGPSRLPADAHMREGPSHRLLVDLADRLSYLSILPPGNSGDPHSPFYAAELAAWSAAGYVRVQHSP